MGSSFKVKKSISSHKKKKKKDEESKKGNFLNVYNTTLEMLRDRKFEIKDFSFKQINEEYGNMLERTAYQI